MKRLNRKVPILALILLVGGSLAKAEEAKQGGRYALVIGNSHYGGSDDVSGIEDAKAMSNTLKQNLNFDSVVTVTDASLNDMTTELASLSSRIKQASVVVFFFSGHGFQSGAENYLMPVDGSVLATSSLPLGSVKTALAWAPNKAVKLVFLDACRGVKELPEEFQGLKEEQAPSSPGTLYAFAAGPGQTTPAGLASETSPYSNALEHYITEPGLKISELLDKVAGDRSLKGRFPSYVINGVPSDFHLREPVYVRAETGDVGGDLLVMVNGEVVLNSKEESVSHLPLRAGHNEISLLMSTDKAYHNGHSWDVTEGWSYDLKIGLQATGAISCSGPGQNGFCFSGREDVPFKDGPHHGQAFVVAKATIVVDGDSNPPRVTLEASDKDFWKHEGPLWSRDQDVLYDQSVLDLHLSADDILSALNLQPPWNILLRPVAEDVLTSGNLLGFKVADPSRTFATVWGNRALKNAVQTCMSQQRAARIHDLQKGIAATFARNPTPFKVFDQGLTNCVRSVGSPLKPDDTRIWTAIQDQSIPPQSTSLSAPVSSQATTPVGGGSHE